MRTLDCLVSTQARLRTVLAAVRKPVRAKLSHFENHPDTFRAHTVPCSMGIWAPSLGVKRSDVISDFRSHVAEKSALLGCYTASSGNLLPTFRDNPMVPSSGFKNPEKRKDY